MANTYIDTNRLPHTAVPGSGEVVEVPIPSCGGVLRFGTPGLGTCGIVGVTPLAPPPGAT